ncbi:MAG: VCBS repeat-containing protein [Armatimonadetes bacterium]|nr:VCBS repeat-containing protein [Armatimonadota bacterium]
MTNLLVLAGLLLLTTAATVVGAKGEWPMPAHDNRLSAQAEVPCNMPQAPKEVWSYNLGQLPIRWAMCADVDDDGKEEVLYGPSPLVCVDMTGKEKWRSACGGVVAIADVDGDGATEIVVDGPAIINGKDGQRVWSRAGTGSVGRYRIFVGKFLPEVKGQQIACASEQYENNYAQMWSFADGCSKAKLVWEREFNKGPVYAHCTASAGRYDENTMCVAAAVHGGIVAMDARDGKDLFRFYWNPHKDEGLMRNYGSLGIQDVDGDGKAEFSIHNDLIAVQLGVFSPPRGGIGDAADQAKPYPSPEAQPGEIAKYTESPILWRRYFGEWFPQGAFTLHVPPSPVVDVDGDGKREVVISVHKDRWDLKVYDSLTGKEKVSVPNLYVHSVADLDGDGVPELIAAVESARTPREFTTLVIGNAVGSKWVERYRRDKCRLEYTNEPLWPLGMGGRNNDQRVPVICETARGKALVVTEGSSGDGRADQLVFISGKPGKKLTRSSVPLENKSDVKILTSAKGTLIASAGDATMSVLGLNGKVKSSWACGRPMSGNAAIADLDGDGSNEVILCRADKRVIALRGPFTGEPRKMWQAEGWGFPANAGHGPMPLVADVDGDGKKEVLVACVAGEGGAGVQLLDSTGKTRWKTALPGITFTSLYAPISRATFGDFNHDDHLDVYVAARIAMTGNDAAQSFALDGRDGKLLWHNDGSAKVIWHHTLGPTGMPAVADMDGDGVDDVLFITLDLCTELNGKDGSFIHEPLIANGIWNQANKSTQWTAYGTQLPVDLNGDGKLEILECAAWGQWGAWTMDRKLLWTFDPGREQHSSRHPGIADVDGDGKLEIGAIHNGGIFRCYDAATGTLKWELTGINQWTDVVTADVDGDGLPEFVAGGGSLAAIKATGPTSGKVLWQTTLPAGTATPAIADIDGDGFGEIVVGCADGKVRICK